MEVALARHHRKEKRFGPSPGNNYTSGYAKGGFLSRFRRRKDVVDESNRLPEHTHPDQLDGRQSYGTETTAVGYDGRGASGDYHKQEAGYGFQNTGTYGGLQGQPQTQVPPKNYRYGDGIYEAP